MCEMLAKALGRKNFECRFRTTADEALALMETEPFDVVVTDLNMRGMNGLALCERIAANRPDVPVVVVTAFGSMETAVAAIRAGAYDFINKPFEIEELKLTLEHAIQHRELREEVKRLRLEVGRSAVSSEIIGSSPAMRKVWDLIDRVASTDATVLVTGESGTGKELVAQAIHYASRRAEGPCVAINCAALPETLIESELFGHERGAFTGADRQKPGRLELAAGGTLFLDEVGELAAAVQAKLLRVLQEREFQRVGGTATLKADFRLIVATNRNLTEAMARGQFREDLYYRLSVFPIHLPPLRERSEDVVLLAQEFVRRLGERMGKGEPGLSRDARELLVTYPWPGNIRELQNAIERALIVSDAGLITAAQLGLTLPRLPSGETPPPAVPTPSRLPSHPAAEATLQELERHAIADALAKAKGNKTAAAAALGITRMQLYTKLKRLGPSQ